MKLSRRDLIWGAAPGLLAVSKTSRLGISYPLAGSQNEARKTLAAFRAAGFQRIQVLAPWAKVDRDYMRALPSWLKGEGLRADVVGAYVNCCNPESVIMNCRREDFAAVLDLAERMRTRCVVAWTGGYGKGTRDFVPRNWTRDAEDAVLRFIESYIRRFEESGLTLALETLYTLVCPDGPSLARLLGRLPRCVGAVLDVASMIPVARYHERDQVLRETVLALKGRVAVVHLKDVRLRPDGKHYDFPGPLDGELNYRLYTEQLNSLGEDVPLIVEHIKPEEFASARQRLLELLSRS